MSWGFSPFYNWLHGFEMKRRHDQNKTIWKPSKKPDYPQQRMHMPGRHCANHTGESVRPPLESQTLGGAVNIRSNYATLHAGTRITSVCHFLNVTHWRESQPFPIHAIEKIYIFIRDGIWKEDHLWGEKVLEGPPTKCHHPASISERGTVVFLDPRGRCARRFRPALLSNVSSPGRASRASPLHLYA